MQYVDGDSIQFESREEIEKIISALHEYQDRIGRDPEIQRMIDMLDVMFISW